MDFELTKEQKDIISAAREFAEGEFPDRSEEFDRDESFDEAIHKKQLSLVLWEHLSKRSMKDQIWVHWNTALSLRNLPRLTRE